MKNCKYCGKHLTQTSEYDTCGECRKRFESKNLTVANAWGSGGNMDFSEALRLLKSGHKVARQGWNGKDMWVSMTKGKTLDLGENDIWTKHVKDVALSNGGKVEILPYLSMKTVDNKIVIGWLASQTDMLAEDWFMVE